jgi:hypothetical protein
MTVSRELASFLGLLAIDGCKSWFEFEYAYHFFSIISTRAPCESTEDD